MKKNYIIFFSSFDLLLLILHTHTHTILYYFDTYSLYFYRFQNTFIFTYISMEEIRHFSTFKFPYCSIWEMYIYRIEKICYNYNFILHDMYLLIYIKKYWFFKIKYFAKPDLERFSTVTSALFETIEYNLLNNIQIFSTVRLFVFEENQTQYKRRFKCKAVLHQH